MKDTWSVKWSETVMPKIKINYPLADEISIQNSTFHYANDSCSEIAFFKKGKWVLDIIPEFAGYQVEKLDTDTLVYSLVPNDLIEDFLDKYREPIIWKKY